MSLKGAARAPAAYAARGGSCFIDCVFRERIMNKGRLEAFSDGVLAIVITVMVLSMVTPEGVTIEAVYAVVPVFVSYLLSFVYVGIYWNSHHHIMSVVRHIDGRSL